jgi:hypothetical protein
VPLDRDDLRHELERLCVQVLADHAHQDGIWTLSTAVGQGLSNNK